MRRQGTRPDIQVSMNRPSSTSWPLHNGTPEQFALVRGFLKQSGYTESAVCERLELSVLHEYSTIAASTPRLLSDDSLVSHLIRLFFCGECLPLAQLKSLLPSEVMDSLRSLGLLCDDPARPGECHSPVALYPAQGLYFVSDRWVRPDRSAFEPSDDIVFPAISHHTCQFLETLPQHPCDDLLDLCSGTGVAALAAVSCYARRAWAVDITERATRCAEFNILLNGLTQVTAIQGDLYGPLNGRMFDRIVAHPPYVPVMKPSKIYYDGGEDGERVTRAIVAGLPQHLKPGGSFYCLTMGVEREGEPFEQRARQWLGDRHAEFDLLFVESRIQDLTDFAYQATVTARGDWSQVEQWKAHFQKLKVKNLAHGALVIRRKTESRPSLTIRRRRGPHSGPAEAEWLLRWEDAAARPGSAAWLLEMKPSVSPQLELRALHCFQQNEFAPVEFALQTDSPFSMECKIQPWMAMLVARCDGNTRILELFEACKRDRLIHPETPVGEFVRLLSTLISGGFLRVEGFEPPRHADPAAPAS